MYGPSPEAKHPMQGFAQVCFIRNTVRDVPAYTIVGGNPAQPIRPRFAPEMVARLEAIAWWDWPVEKITAHLDRITGADVDALEEAATAS